jgi:hypothetical protein
LANADKKADNSNEDLDIKNRAARELEASQNLAVHLQAQVKELEDIKAKMEKEIDAYDKVATTLYEQSIEIAEEGENSKVMETRLLSRKAVTAIRSLQKEAHDVIRSLETRLESAIRIGDVAMETAITLSLSPTGQQPISPVIGLKSAAAISCPTK